MSCDKDDPTMVFLATNTGGASTRRCAANLEQESRSMRALAVQQLSLLSVVRSTRLILERRGPEFIRMLQT